MARKRRKCSPPPGQMPPHPRRRRYGSRRAVMMPGRPGRCADALCPTADNATAPAALAVWQPQGSCDAGAARQMCRYPLPHGQMPPRLWQCRPWGGCDTATARPAQTTPVPFPCPWSSACGEAASAPLLQRAGRGESRAGPFLPNTNGAPACRRGGWEAICQ